MNNLAYQTTLGASSVEPWKTQFAFFWYNDQEIFHDTDKDLEIKAEQLAESGDNHLITFSCTHFRWSFFDYWNLLNASKTLEDQTGDGINHEDPIPFPLLSKKVIEITIRLPKQFEGRRLAMVLAHDPNRTSPLLLEASSDAGPS